MNRSIAFIVLICGAILVADVSAAVASSPARVLRIESAHTPEIACMAGIEGEVTVQVQVLSSGQVGSVEVSSTSHPLLNQSAVLSAWMSTFAPAQMGGVAASGLVQLDFEFRCDGESGLQSPMSVQESKEFTVDLLPNQVCLYGIWLSGPVVVRLSEDRVFVDGIRVYPSIFDFGGFDWTNRAAWHVFAEELELESTIFERELALRGVEPAQIRSQTLELLSGTPGVESVAKGPQGSLEVTVRSRDTAVFGLPDPTAEGNVLSPDSMRNRARAEEQYYVWLKKLHPGLGRSLYLHFTGVSTGMSVANEKAIEIFSFLESNGTSRNSSGGIDWPNGLGQLMPFIEAMIRKPPWVPRL